MRRFLADLHIHTALSPCADDQMTPPAIVKRSSERGLDIIAICDHNSAGNVRSTQLAAGGSLVVLAGIEITTAEEAHVVGLFTDASSAESCGRRVLATLPTRASLRGGSSLRDRPGVSPLDRQWLMDAAGQVIGSEDRMLAVASTFRLDRAVELIHSFGGLAIAAHADRPSMSVLSQLGVFPADAGLDAIELGGYEALPELKSCGLMELRSSDSHFLDDIGSKATELMLASASFEELRLAIICKRGGLSGSA